ncbi:MAG: enoyl-CoA hydratase [Nocardioides sp.]|nr:enoyl-CoA hydratase [Nocardioides sp.]
MDADSTAPKTPATTPTATVALEVEQGVATVRIARPDAMNALDVATKERLLEVLREVAVDPGVRCVVLTGTGPRAFCVGQDLAEHMRLMEVDRSKVLSTVEKHYNPIVTALVEMDKPVLAKVNGVAAGAGMSLALACDLRVVADTAGFNTSFAGVALSCDTGASYLLPRLVGHDRALELLYLPRTVKADEALSLGLATRVVPADRLDTEVDELARRLAAGPTVALGSMRRAVAHSADHDFRSALAFEGRMMTRTGDTADHRTAVESFLAKQTPRFQGR